MSNILKKLKSKNSYKTEIKNLEIKLNDFVNIKRISGEFKNNIVTVNGICTDISKSENGTRVTLKTFLYDEVVFQSFLLESPSIIKLNINQK